MVRKGKWKYIQFGHYLPTYKDYAPQLFDVESDPKELNDTSSLFPDVVSEMESILSSLINYEYIDCLAKRNDYQIFEEYYWKVENETQIKEAFDEAYTGFDDGDWQLVLDWRSDVKNAPSCDQLL